MRLLLVGTELAPVHADAGALELLLTGWAGALAAAGHDVWLGSAPHAGDPPPGVGLRFFRQPAELEQMVDEIAPDVVVANNRPGWQSWLPATTLHLFHNWPDAWALAPDAPTSVAGAGLAAVGTALAETVAVHFRRDDVAVVRPWVDPVFAELRACPDGATVLFPNRLMRKKGVAELCAAAARPALAGARILVPDHLSPWTEPTEEHRVLRALVERSPRCQLIPPARSRADMAALYAGAGVAACPSVRPEGLGLSALEAQAAGVPVVSSGLGGLTEASLIPSLVVDPSDPDALAVALAAGLALPVPEREGLRRSVAGTWDLDSSTASLLAAVTRMGR